MTPSSKMTAICDKIRTLLGISGKMGLDAMSTNLGTIQTHISNAFTAVSNRGGSIPSSKVSGTLASAINSIPKGVIVQQKTGTFTTNSSGQQTVVCGFQPDFIYIKFYEYYGYEDGVCLPFALQSASNEYLCTMGYYAAAKVYECSAKRTQNGFYIQINDLSSFSNGTGVNKKTFTYTAVKYT